MHSILTPKLQNLVLALVWHPQTAQQAVSYAVLQVLVFLQVAPMAAAVHQPIMVAYLASHAQHGLLYNTHLVVLRP